jgi:hypothetical protein
LSKDMEVWQNLANERKLFRFFPLNNQYLLFMHSINFNVNYIQ